MRSPRESTESKQKYILIHCLFELHIMIIFKKKFYFHFLLHILFFFLFNLFLLGAFQQGDCKNLQKFINLFCTKNAHTVNLLLHYRFSLLISTQILMNFFLFLVEGHKILFDLLNKLYKSKTFIWHFLLDSIIRGFYSAFVISHFIRNLIKYKIS